MTPSHAQRGRKRYRYYVTRPDEVDGSPAWRVNAYDLERLVCEQIAQRLDPDSLMLVRADTSNPSVRSILEVSEKAADITSILQSGKVHAKANLLEKILGRVDLDSERVTIALDRAGLAGLAHQLDLPPELLEDDFLQLIVPAVRVRRGHQLRLIIPGPGQARLPPPRRDPKLVALIAEAITARELIETHPDRSIKSLAEQHGRCRTRLGKLVQLSCLAPDIVKAILEGRQPEMLDAKKLATIRLPLAWEDQRTILGFA